MKRCPVCSRIYADQSLNFCLDDGNKLVAADELGGAPHPKRRASDIPTEVLPSEQAPHAAPQPTLPASPRPTANFYEPPPPARNSKLLIAILVVVLLTGGVGLGLILTSRGNGEKSRADADNSARATVEETPKLSTPTPYAAATPTSTPTATPSPTATPERTPNLSSARSEVMSVMNNWAESLRRQDVAGNLRLYADQLDAYYKRGSVSREQVRADRQAIFSKFYSSTDVQLDNVSIELDPSATQARVTYDNSYNWRGGSKYLTGKSHNAMTLSKRGPQWLITSEEHLKTYGERSGN